LQPLKIHFHKAEKQKTDPSCKRGGFL